MTVADTQISQAQVSQTVLRDTRPEGAAKPTRVVWVDTARGWCIVLVVMMHSALGVGVAVGDSGWLHAAVAFAKPFRMPDFFLIAGLFAAKALDYPLRRFLDRKVLHFAYFYALWLLIALVVKAHALGIADPASFATTFAWHLIEPFSSTWFIQVLPILYVLTRAVRRVPTLVILGTAFALHMLAAAYPMGGAFAMESQLTGWTTIDGLLLFWIYFLIGVRFRTEGFKLAEAAATHRRWALIFLFVWFVFEAVATRRLWPEVYGLGLPFGLLGAIAVIVTSALVARLAPMKWLAYLGRHSLIVYLAFFLPMAVTRSVFLYVAPNADVGLVSLVVTCAAIAGPLALERVLRGTWFSFLFDRPRWARLREATSPTGRRHPDESPIDSVMTRAGAT